MLISFGQLQHSQFQKLVSLVEIVFHGLGGGAERLATVAGLTANHDDKTEIL